MSVRDVKALFGGAKHEIDIWTDHQNLKYFMSAKKFNHQQAHWALFLS